MRLCCAVMSDTDNQVNVLQAFQAGATDYLIKPLRSNEVATLWQHAWRLKSSQHRSADPTKGPAAADQGACERRSASRNASTSNQEASTGGCEAQAIEIKVEVKLTQHHAWVQIERYGVSTHNPST